ncbi:MAG: MFS transporter [Deltaproteobacteria bacterium]|nr:MFS transporter [Deltaproteobacteria bacterium]
MTDEAKQALRRSLPGTVLALGAVSFLTDVSSEMIYPLLPVFLATVLGVGALYLGVIEGVAESTASLLKVVSGAWSDRLKRRRPLLAFGYGLSGAARPLIGLAAGWPFVLAMRFLDRIGKGLRTSPRDALIADVTDPSIRGRAFGLHRAMDHAGAVVGPLAAAGLLSYAGVTLRHVFLLAAAPAVLVMLVIALGVRERKAREPGPSPRLRFKAGLREMGPGFRRLLAALLVFTLGNSTDAFLLLRLGDAGLTAGQVALLWSAHHVVKMAATYAGGRLSDRLGRRPMIACGWIVYAAVYLAFALVGSRAGLVAVFLSYGLYFGLTEPAEKAWVADLVPERLRGTAFGLYHGAIGLAALPASLLFGLLWHAFGSPVAFVAGAGLAAIAAVLLLRVNDS